MLVGERGLELNAIQNFLQTLQEEIEIINGGDTAINNGSRAWITSAVCVCFFGRVETSMVTLALSDI